MGAASGTLPGAWTMQVEDSQVELSSDSESSATGQNVKGKLLKGESVESRFVADSGEADTKTGRLVLRGNVRVTSERDGIYLTADKVTYDEKLALVIAEGGVEVHSEAWMSGPFAKLVATPGLEKVGTPDRFGL